MKILSLKYAFVALSTFVAASAIAEENSRIFAEEATSLEDSARIFAEDSSSLHSSVKTDVVPPPEFKKRHHPNTEGPKSGEEGAPAGVIAPSAVNPDGSAKIPEVDAGKDGSSTNIPGSPASADGASTDKKAPTTGEDGANSDAPAPSAGEDGVSASAPEAAKSNDSLPLGSEDLPAFDDSTICTYSSYAWDTVKQKATGREHFKKTYGELTAEERSEFDPRCTVCSEDQVEIAIEGLPTIKICRYYAKTVRAALEELKAQPDFVITALEGYRPGKTRGPIVNGKRSLFSNHSYGTAIDINAPQNAIYSNCQGKRESEDDLAGCKRNIGGPWRPKADPKHSVYRGGPAFRIFTRFWKWGGDLPKTKDFMHFSITGE